MGPRNIFITGGAGYVGSALVPDLLEKGHNVTVFDTFWYGDVFANIRKNEKLKQVRGDIRDISSVSRAMDDADTVIHLACISNDPSFEMDPNLGKSINLDSFPGLVDEAKKHAIKRFIYASSSSIYGIKEGDVVEETSADPLTDYSKFKLECESILKEKADDMPFTIIRPATVCGYAPRLRLDVVVNVLTINALERKVISVDGGDQLRPNIPIKDMVRAYNYLLDADNEKINGEAFNAGGTNYSVMEIANKVQSVIPDTRIEVKPVKDPRSYHINSEKIKNALGFEPLHSIEDAVQSIAEAHRLGLIKDGLNNPRYHNIKRMKELNIDSKIN